MVWEGHILQVVPVTHKNKRLSQSFGYISEKSVNDWLGVWLQSCI